MIGVMDEHNNPETAALVVVANAMMNMDEVDHQKLIEMTSE